MRTTVGLRFLYGYMNYDKQPINIDEQLALLQNRGLMIGDIVTAKLQLRNISYFRIASYLRYMEEDQLHHLYKSGSTFEQAINLYLFDKELRQLIFKAIQDIEHTNRQNSYKCATQKSSSKRGITYRPDVIHYDYDRRKARFYDSTPRRVLHLLP